ncbi:MAG: hypothetical protein GF308_13575 [Candidatus Heimdallarchaeota archaeon]|nr:hypothetical protein [Candidatus Heimdallarchaeota archaeon]
MKAFNSQRISFKEMELKTKIQNMPNQVLINEWKNIREINQGCPSAEPPTCEFCAQKNNCFYFFMYEKVLTEEIIARGLFHFALLSITKKATRRTTQKVVITTRVTEYEQFVWPN